MSKVDHVIIVSRPRERAYRQTADKGNPLNSKTTSKPINCMRTELEVMEMEAPDMLPPTVEKIQIEQKLIKFCLPWVVLYHTGGLQAPSQLHFRDKNSMHNGIVQKRQCCLTPKASKGYASETSRFFQRAQE